MRSVILGLRPQIIWAEFENHHCGRWTDDPKKDLIIEIHQWYKWNRGSRSVKFNSMLKISILLSDVFTRMLQTLQLIIKRSEQTEKYMHEINGIDEKKSTAWRRIICTSPENASLPSAEPNPNPTT
ncbi:hypothetical protein YC2023_016597 [Brassica napus]